MLIVEFDVPPFWSLNANETGEDTKYPWVGVVEGMAGVASIDQHGGPSNSTIDIYDFKEKRGL